MLKKIWNAFIEKLRILNMVPCTCGSRDDHWVVKDQIEGIVCEASIVCDNCGKETNYWAYGNTQYPETYTGIISEAWHRMNPVQKYKNWKFERGMKRNHWRV